MRPRRLCHVLLVLAGALLASPAAHAVASCSITSVTLGTLSYSNAALSSAGTVNYTCIRTSNKTDGTISFNISAGPGSYSTGSSRNVGNGANRIAYSLATTAAWGDGSAGLGNPAAATVTMTGNTDTYSGSLNFTLTVPAAQSPNTGLTYTDTFAVGGTCAASKGSACSVTGSTRLVTIDTPVSCSISSPPGTVSLAYTSFQASPASGNVSFGVNCSRGGPYRMSVSPTTGSVLGIAYALKLGTSANSATDVSSTSAYTLSGTGSTATYFINASAAANQQGICSALPCSQQGANHTLTVEY